MNQNGQQDIATVIADRLHDEGVSYSDIDEFMSVFDTMISTAEKAAWPVAGLKSARTMLFQVQCVLMSREEDL